MTQGMADFLETLGDTSKTAVMAVLLILATVFRIRGYIDGPGFVDLMKTTVVSYFSTTAVVHFTSMVKDHLSNKLQEIKNQVTSNKAPL